MEVYIIIIILKLHALAGWLIIVIVQFFVDFTMAILLNLLYVINSDGISVCYHVTARVLIVIICSGSYTIL